MTKERNRERHRKTGINKERTEENKRERESSCERERDREREIVYLLILSNLGGGFVDIETGVCISKNIRIKCMFIYFIDRNGKVQFLEN